MVLTPKQYRNIKLLVVAILAVTFSQLIIFKAYLLAIPILVASSLVLLYLRRRVDAVIADERDYNLAGKSALLAMQIYSWVAVVAMFALRALEDMDPVYKPVAMTLAFSVCGLLILYSLIFKLSIKK